VKKGKERIIPLGGRRDAKDARGQGKFSSYSVESIRGGLASRPRRLGTGIEG